MKRGRAKLTVGAAGPSAVCRRNAPAQAGTTNAGTTLVEVLMSLLVMGIGVVAVATLFPASVLRSIQATQLTNATILRYDAEAAIALLPSELIHDPDRNGNLVEHNDTNYFVDPWGATEIGGDVGTFKRFSGGFSDKRKARDFVSLPDSWIHVVSAVVTATTASSVTLPTTIDLTGLAIDEDRNQNGTLDTGETDLNGNGVADNTPSRVVLFDEVGRRSEVREILSYTGQTVSWATSATLPAGFTPARARIETSEPRYSWLLTARKTSAGIANVDIVVFFRRTLDVNDERLYTANYQGSGKYNVTVAASDPKPYWKRGGYLFDITSGRWHRVQKVTESTGDVIVEGNPNQTIGQTSVLFPRGVIEVYPIGNWSP